MQTARHNNFNFTAEAFECCCDFVCSGKKVFDKDSDKEDGSWMILIIFATTNIFLFGFKISKLLLCLPGWAEKERWEDKKKESKRRIERGGEERSKGRMREWRRKQWDDYTCDDIKNLSTCFGIFKICML